MAAKEQPNLIGFDPLAWVSVDKEIQAVQNQKNTPVTDANQQQCSGAIELTTIDPIEIDPAGVDQAVKTGAIALDEVLNIQNIGGLYERLLKLFEANDEIEIDVSAVRVIDTATLQLLVLLKQEAIKMGKAIVFDFPSERFIEAAQLLGLDALLDVDHPESGLF